MSGGGASEFVAHEYGPRAQDYLTSAVHSGGADLDQIEAELQGHRNARVLDLGCGGGHVSFRAAPLVREVVACDITPSMLEAVVSEANRRGLANVTVERCAAEDLPFPDDCFDFVLCRFTTHHWPSLDAGVRQARRVLKKKGRAIFVDSVSPQDATLDTHLQVIELLRDPSHVRNYTLAEWVAALSRSGFAISGVVRRMLRMEFGTWTARTRTAPARVEAIRLVQESAPPIVREHFAVSEDGSFDLEAATFVVDAI
ncbi:MAG: class I SAM-dependent methyltransferase [Acetobacteraceae bacterium]|nr:class I SAM-dependent methyltransferase [Acetobacteraceae bacterium]